MPRPKRADEKNAIYHALNRGNGGSVIFHKEGDYEAFGNILIEGLVRYPCRILSCQLMPIHWHFVLQRTEDGGMSNFLRWVTLTHTMRYPAHDAHLPKRFGRTSRRRVSLRLAIFSVSERRCYAVPPNEL